MGLPFTPCLHLSPPSLLPVLPTLPPSPRSLLLWTQREIYKLMEKDAFPRFIRSAPGKRVLLRRDISLSGALGADGSVRQGLLFKRGGFRHDYHMPVSWHERWFVLKRGMLVYFNSQVSWLWRCNVKMPFFLPPARVSAVPFVSDGHGIRSWLHYSSGRFSGRPPE